ncbi:hypothetical protein MtrunA17_Chr3g0126231 [Medicago truncatula]|uniref:Uncharacterized protein n=1 Tax=Medicago truncatula TaxID=3880 RepID=G7J678_MEDTR|nr:hypothetical protein MTR_3g090620 [Medicago truncatula]RHN69580.1 hypothetical protein MtrunA17_Chr3g0126231 [Medicago truncatula]
MCNRKRGGEVQEEEWLNNALNQTQTKELTTKKKERREPPGEMLRSALQSQKFHCGSRKERCVIQTI